MNRARAKVGNAATRVVLASVLLFAALLELRIAFGSVRAVRLNFRAEPPNELALHPERADVPGLGNVVFMGAKQTRIAAWFVPPRNRAVVLLLHGTSADRTSLLPEVRLLSKADFGVLALDFPGYGSSEGTITWGAGERAAIEAAVDWLARRPDVDPNRIGAYGFSMGGYVLAQVAAGDRRIRAIVFAATPTDMREQTAWEARRWGPFSRGPAELALSLSGMPLEDAPPVRCVEKIAPRPLLFLAGDADTTVPPPMTNALFAAAREPKTLWFVGGARHGGYASTAPWEYEQRLVAFFSRTLLKSATT